ncbi:hypothetical protein [Methanopyrus kandleri]|uniref:Uncharacterized protein n=1 Tax=Methanopyrus kandleri TaxID=2320 RepID=A0A832TAF5_9EURY|nr:hypothetical protein [Methanopyrus kandleri]HII69856.1 hypothetical protein [Methanopyrus kandleri]
MKIEAGEAVRILAYLFFLFFVLPVLIAAIVLTLAPLIVLFTIILAFVLVFAKIPWTPPEFSLAAEAALLALYRITGEKVLKEIAENLARHRRKSLKLDREKELEEALREDDTGRALRICIREITEKIAGGPLYAESRDRGDD